MTLGRSFNILMILFMITSFVVGFIWGAVFERWRSDNFTTHSIITIQPGPVQLENS